MYIALRVGLTAAIIAGWIIAPGSTAEDLNQFCFTAYLLLTIGDVQLCCVGRQIK